MKYLSYNLKSIKDVVVKKHYFVRQPSNVIKKKKLTVSFLSNDCIDYSELDLAICCLHDSDKLVNYVVDILLFQKTQKEIEALLREQREIQGLNKDITVCNIRKEVDVL